MTSNERTQAFAELPKTLCLNLLLMQLEGCKSHYKDYAIPPKAGMLPNALKL